MHTEKSLVPRKIITECDFGFYFVSKRAYEKIQQNFFLPFIKLQNHQNLKKNRNFSYFLILRKEIHLIFESICKKKIVFNQFEKIEHLLTKEIYLSLQNIEYILSLKLVYLLEEERAKFKDHFLNCVVN